MQEAFDKAEAEFAEALVIRRRLAMETPAKFNANLAETLHEYGVMLGKKGDLTRAAESLGQALEIRKSLAQESPDRFLTEVAESETAFAEISGRCLKETI